MCISTLDDFSTFLRENVNDLMLKKFPNIVETIIKIWATNYEPKHGPIAVIKHSCELIIKKIKVKSI